VSADNNVIISVKDLKKYYNGGEVKALDGVTTDIKKGEE
jgi:polar amino acid transport system ATP-binding protein